MLIGFDETGKIIPKLVEAGLTTDKKKWYLVDGNLSNSYNFPPGTLKGAKGTLPGADGGQAFRDKLLKTDPKLEDFSYAPESYDATVLIALAAEQAKSDAPGAIAKNLKTVSEGGTKCNDFVKCVELIKPAPTSTTTVSAARSPSTTPVTPPRPPSASTSTATTTSTRTSPTRPARSDLHLIHSFT